MKKLVVLGLVLLGGCDLLEPSVPECYNSDTKKLVEEILADNPIFSEFNITIDSAYETDYSKPTKTRTCEAIIKYNPTDAEAKDAVVGIKMLFGTEITYTVKIVKVGTASYTQLVEIQ